MPVGFIADAMLGRLAKRLRFAGFDTAYERQIGDSELLERARREDRVVITRDRRLAKRRLARTAILIHHNEVEHQWRELLGKLPELSAGQSFTRCAECNTLLQPLDREKARPLVPPYIYQTHEKFSKCLGCGRIYWPGTHLDRIRRKLEG